MQRLRPILLFVTFACRGGAGDALTAPAAQPARAGECSVPKAGRIWCDDFESDRAGSYFEVDDASGSFVRVAGVGLDSSTGMRVRWQVGTVNAGSLHLAFGRTPSSYMKPVDGGASNYREIYWRIYVKLQAGWTGGGGEKLSRAIVFATDSWAEATISHVWSMNRSYLGLDPASGTDAGGTLKTTGYNDFPNLRWLGAQVSTTPIFDADHVGKWHCVEAHVRLNDFGENNGVNELWINGNLEAQATNLNWLGSFNDYGINAVFFENYWNDGSPAAQERYFDNIVVSTQRIGCDTKP